MIDFACQHDRHKKNGKDENGTQRYKCLDCGQRFRLAKESLLGELRIDLPRAELILNMLVEGSSVSAAARITNTDPHTILRLLTLVGGRCKNYLERRLCGLKVNSVQMDEAWQYIGCHARLARFSPDRGDSWLYLAIESETKLILCWQLSKRNSNTTNAFCAKLAYATFGHFKLSSDSLPSYHHAVWSTVGNRVTYGQLTKKYGHPVGSDQRRYAPPSIIGSVRYSIIGRPKKEDICTSHCERENANLRLFIRRMSRLTLAYSKKWANHEAMIALYVAHHNFCRKHKTLKTTPAVAQGLEQKPWTMRELLEAIND